VEAETIRNSGYLTDYNQKREKKEGGARGKKDQDSL
jgi:hypothetical protein